MYKKQRLTNGMVGSFGQKDLNVTTDGCGLLCAYSNLEKGRGTPKIFVASKRRILRQSLEVSLIPWQNPPAVTHTSSFAQQILGIFSSKLEGIFICYKAIAFTYRP
ncbi:hypothetical protein H4Q26_005021 [Puccinia striiformis f. sp. tritici PST-130]|nr:hypothetical protein H4Q26_005021 [Puccinia striiformis f. sp. tritici PST-130]